MGVHVPAGGGQAAPGGEARGPHQDPAQVGWGPEAETISGGALHLQPCVATLLRGGAHSQNRSDISKF